MAAAPLKHSVLWIPSRTVGERALINEPLLRLAQAGREGMGLAIQRCSLEALPAIRSAVLVFDARDVALMRVKLPPLSGARLLRALPNVLEDQLLQDPQTCTFVLGPPPAAGEDRLVAVIDRAWFEFVIGALERRGVRLMAAWPGQLTAPLVAGGWSLTCLGETLALRLSGDEGVGWYAGREATDWGAALSALLDTASALRPKPVQLSFAADDSAWQPVVEAVAAQASLPLQAVALSVDVTAPINLLAARQGNAGQRWFAAVEWRSWRMPAVVGCAALLTAVIGLNLHWAQLARERTELRQRMEAVFRQSFPKAQVVIDPLLQFQRQTAELRLRSGQNAPDDFLPLVTRFTQALGPQAANALAVLEYREGQLKARWREGILDPASREQLGAACQRAGLQLRFEGDAQAIIKVAG
jgi:general secretion pathway protein L